MKALLSNSNSKLKKDKIKSFGLPAGYTCPYASACKAFCYAQKGCFKYPVVKAAQQQRFEATRSQDFEEQMSKELKSGMRVRIHDSGDFYSEAYLAKWISLALKHPGVLFYAYTKSVRFFVNKTLPANFRVIFSYGGKEDYLIDPEKHYHARIFNNKEELEAAGYADASESDLVAAIGESRRIGLIFH